MKMKPLYVLVHDDNKFRFNDELETLSTNGINYYKGCHSETNQKTHPFFILLDFSLIFSHFPRNLSSKEQKFCTINRELIGIVYSLTKYEHNNIGSDHFIIVLNDHKTILSCFTKKEIFLQKFTLHKCN